MLTLTWFILICVHAFILLNEPRQDIKPNLFPELQCLTLTSNIYMFETRNCAGVYFWCNQLKSIQEVKQEKI